jgi:ascorbate-specific PTS system EIIC-type component UlaA
VCTTLVHVSDLCTILYVGVMLSIYYSITNTTTLAEMRRLADKGDVSGALRVLSSAVKCGVKLDIIVYTVALNACAK